MRKLNADKAKGNRKKGKRMLFDVGVFYLNWKAPKSLSDLV